VSLAWWQCRDVTLAGRYLEISQPEHPRGYPYPRCSSSRWWCMCVASEYERVSATAPLADPRDTLPRMRRHDSLVEWVSVGSYAKQIKMHLSIRATASPSRAGHLGHLRGIDRFNRSRRIDSASTRRTCYGESPRELSRISFRSWTWSSRSSQTDREREGGGRGTLQRKISEPLATILWLAISSWSGLLCRRINMPNAWQFVTEHPLFFYRDS